MAEKSGELRNAGEFDPMATTGIAKKQDSLERFSAENFETAGSEFNSDVDEAPVETEHIKAQIQETRSQMGETIDAIQERLSFANISEQVSETVNSAIESAKETAYDATIGKAVNFMKNFGDGVTQSSTIRTIKSNPFPFALIGLGAGMLFYQSYNSKSVKTSARFDGRYGKRFTSQDVGQPDESRLASAARPERETTGGTFDGITKTASSAMGTVSGAASSAIGSVGDAAETAYDGVTGAVSTAYSGAGQFAKGAYDRAGDFGTAAQEKYDEYLEENPLALGALAVAVGAAVGFAIPSTRYEGQLMGEARENLVQRAQEAAGTLVDKAKQVASEAGETIKQETRSLTQ